MSEPKKTCVAGGAENAGREIEGQFAGHEIAGHEIDGPMCRA